ncbi:uncharacterized protein LOC111253958 isoform X2 [Varroa destructor]|uniref:CW-type domain-containing protein n=1 Tax=Varroa destructor TaxID=109461 RepID=A0A7M7KSC7_VARDE|nr:uncharacterized protein LOC111253958 isoform X2 [Varroa destructor]
MNTAETLVNVIKDCTVAETSDTALSLLDFRLHKDIEGLWVQCDRCDSWRHVLSAKDPVVYAERDFYCSEVKKHCGSASDPGVDGLFYHPEFFPGNIVWAQKEKDSIGVGFVWWPALIEDGHDRRSQFFLLDVNRSSESRPIAYHVTFLDTFRTGGWVSANKIIRFKDDPSELLRYQQQKCVRKVPKRARLMTEAIERARNALRTGDIRDRLELFSFVAYVARQRGLLEMSDSADYIANGASNGAPIELSLSSSEQTVQTKSQLPAKKRPRLATFKEIEKPKQIRKNVSTVSQTKRKAFRNSKELVRQQQPSFVHHLTEGVTKHLNTLDQRMGKPQVVQSAHEGAKKIAATELRCQCVPPDEKIPPKVDKLTLKVQNLHKKAIVFESGSVREIPTHVGTKKAPAIALKPMKSQYAPLDRDILSEVDEETSIIQKLAKEVIDSNTYNEEEARAHAALKKTATVAQKSMKSQNMPPSQKALSEVDNETQKVQKRLKKSLPSESCSVKEAPPTAENFPEIKRTDTPQTQEGELKGVIKRPANPMPRNKKSLFVAPTKQTFHRIIRDSEKSPKKAIQDEPIQPVLAENRAPKMPFRVETDPPVRQPMPPQQPQKVRRTSQGGRRSPSPYTVDWLEATFESKCAQLMTDSDCDSGIVDSLGRSDEYSPPKAAQKSAVAAPKQIQANIDQVNASHKKPKTLTAHAPIRPKPTFSVPARRPFKPSFQEGKPGLSRTFTGVSKLIKSPLQRLLVGQLTDNHGINYSSARVYLFRIM